MKKKKKKRKIRKKVKIKKKKTRIFIKSKKLYKKRRKSKSKRKRKTFSKKPVIEGFIRSIKLKITLNFRELFKKITSPIVKEIKDYRKNKEKLELKKKKEIEKEKKIQSSLRKELLKKEIKEEQAIAKTRAVELKSFMREEQKIIREKEKEKQRKFLEEVKLEKTLERFRAREIEEIKAIEKYTLNIEKEDYKAFQERIDEVREKYKSLRNERLRKRVEELGVTLSDEASIEEIRQKEKEYLQRRELIETSLESFTRSATSLVYQINKRYLPKNADLLRVINLVYEQSEIIIREDQEQNENFLILIYIKDQDSKKEIIVEDKIKQETREYNRNAIFKFGDDLTDSLILYLERIRDKMKKAS
tara:strand:+ start:186 stop:1268 length:1083 start_codon:yes stop_codon:yes gene_type:complete